MEWDILKSFCFNSQKIIIPLYHIESFSIATSKYCCEQKEHSSKSQEKRVWFTDSPPNQPGDLSPLIFPPRASVSNVSGERPGLCDLFRFPRPPPPLLLSHFFALGTVDPGGSFCEHGGLKGGSLHQFSLRWRYGKGWGWACPSHGRCVLLCFKPM